MEREVGDSIQIGIMLILVSILISIVWFTVSLGLRVETTTESRYTNITESINNSQLNSLKYQSDVIMPKAAIYGIVARESELIYGMRYTFPDAKVYEISKKDDVWQCKNGGVTILSRRFLQDILSDKATNQVTGKVSVEVTTNDTGLYFISIKEID